MNHRKNSLFEKLVQIVREFVSLFSEAERRAYFLAALQPYPRFRDSIEWGGSAEKFASHLIGRCFDQWKLHDGKLSCVLILEEIFDQVGIAQREAIIRLIQEVKEQAGPPLDEPPYKGLDSYRHGDQTIFYGRSQAIELGVQKMRQGGRNLLTLIGASGTGKSSLIHAGIVPRFNERDEWEVCEVRFFNRPIFNLCQALDLKEERNTITNQLMQRLDACKAKKMLVVFDQYEELYTQADPEEAVAAATINTIEQAVRILVSHPNSGVIIAVRDEVYSLLKASDIAPLLTAAWVAIDELPFDIHEAICAPAAALNVEVEDGVVTQMMADAGDIRRSLPFMQITMQTLWRKGARERKITQAHYDALEGDGNLGLRGAIASHANLVYGGLSADQRAVACRIFLRLIQFDAFPGMKGKMRQHGRRQVAYAGLTSTDVSSDLLKKTVAALVDARLLATTYADNIDDLPKYVDLMHEVLIYNWGQLQAWIEALGSAEMTRRALHKQAERWQRGERDILDRTELAYAKRWQKEHATIVGFTSEVDQFLQASSFRWREWRRTGQAYAFIVLLVFALAYAGYRTFLYQSAQNLSPTVSVEGQSFEIDQYAVTNELYRLCVRTSFACTGSEGPHIQNPTRQDEPVTNVTAIDATEFCRWMNRSLPTDDEWLIAYESLHEEEFHRSGLYEWTRTYSSNSRLSNDRPHWDGVPDNLRAQFLIYRMDLEVDSTGQGRTLDDGSIGFRCVTYKE